ncbi:MAG: hypothetical protein KKH66_04200 [Proteobacteria bacterium]|nr:hypothetical protein [Pseudomonadota bacterium]
MRFATIIFGFYGGNKRLLAVCLGCLLLLSVGGCATERWCKELGDYTTLEADQEHCDRKSGFWGQVWPGAFDNCMESLGWRTCQERASKP